MAVLYSVIYCRLLEVSAISMSCLSLLCPLNTHRQTIVSVDSRIEPLLSRVEHRKKKTAICQ